MQGFLRLKGPLLLTLTPNKKKMFNLQQQPKVCFFWSSGSATTCCLKIAGFCILCKPAIFAAVTGCAMAFHFNQLKHSHKRHSDTPTNEWGGAQLKSRHQTSGFPLNENSTHFRQASENRQTKVEGSWTHPRRLLEAPKRGRATSFEDVWVDTHSGSSWSCLSYQNYNLLSGAAVP